MGVDDTYVGKILSNNVIFLKCTILVMLTNKKVIIIDIDNKKKSKINLMIDKSFNRWCEIIWKL
jgi:hypothetical protein